MSKKNLHFLTYPSLPAISNVCSSREKGILSSFYHSQSDISTGAERFAEESVDENTPKMLLGLFCWERVFKFTCTLLTLLLICQELYYFAVTKPTVTSAEEKGIDIRDLPEVVICLDTGFNKTVLKKYGYKDHYSMGSLDGKGIIGWNGNENET